MYERENKMLKNQIEIIKNLVGTVSDHEMKYQLNRMFEEHQIVNFKTLINYVGTVSDHEMKYQLDRIKEDN